LQERAGSYRVIFRHNGNYHTFTLGTVSQDEAETKAAHVDYLLMRLKQRLITLPEGVDIVTLRLHEQPYVAVEAKKEGVTFTIPHNTQGTIKLDATTPTINVLTTPRGITAKERKKQPSTLPFKPPRS